MKVIQFKNVSKSFKVSHDIGNSIFGQIQACLTMKKFKRIRVLDNISFEIKKNDFVGVIGRNGAGKTTLAKIISGIIVPDSGSVMVDGIVVSIFHLGIGFNPELSGRENLMLNSALIGIPKNILKQRYEKIMAFAGIGEFIDAKLKTFSSGMAARLAFAVAAHAPKDIMVVDEALVVGDVAFNKATTRFFQQYKENGKTLVYVSNSPESILAHCNKCIYLREGSIRFGPADAIIHGYLQDVEDHEADIVLRQ